MKHRTITGLAAVALLAVAATAASMRSHSPWTGSIVSAGTTSLKGVTVDVNKPPTADFDERWSAMFASARITDTAQRGLAQPTEMRGDYQPQVDAM
jgi:hypothetical protein